MVRRRHLQVSLSLLTGMLLIGCGGAPTGVKTPVQSTPTQQYHASSAPSPAPAAPSDDISKNPFVLWIKLNHPQEAAQIIDDYLSTRFMGNGTPDPTIEAERDKLRRQAIDTVAGELLKNVQGGLPQGLQANRVGNRVRVLGAVVQQGQTINLTFDFDVRIDPFGIMWITQPADTVKATTSSWLAKLFGGDLKKKATEQIVATLDKEGPKNAAMTKGLSYLPGGTFRLDPGVAFVNMPAN
ncbi:MAG TPA: hypothetical protein V6D05_01630 [Stenomitos sp.]